MNAWSHKVLSILAAGGLAAMLVATPLWLSANAQVNPHWFLERVDLLLALERVDECETEGYFCFWSWVAYEGLVNDAQRALEAIPEAHMYPDIRALYQARIDAAKR